MLTPAQADELIGQHLTGLPIESLPLAQCAGAVLRENVYAERDQPPFDRGQSPGDSSSLPRLRGWYRRNRRRSGQANEIVRHAPSVADCCATSPAGEGRNRGV